MHLSKHPLVLVSLFLAACGHSERVPAEASKPAETRVVAQIFGREQAEWIGYSLGVAGDVNGDKRPDFMVSGLSASHGGRVCLVYGPLTEELSVTQCDVVIDGEQAFHNAGESLVEAGGCDVDGDGFSDLLLGAPFADRTNIAASPATSGDNTGKVYLVYGGKSLPHNLSLRSADEVFVGVDSYEVAGKAVACLSDLDGDGRDDFAIGAPRAGRDHQGAVYLWYGKKRGTYGAAPVGLENADAKWVGAASHDLTGTSVAQAGDLDNDGLLDVAIGAPGSDEGGRDAGAVYLILGSKDRLHGELSFDPRARVSGSEGRRIGVGVTRAGDFDGDGQSDLLLSSAGIGRAAFEPGQAFLVRGSRKRADIFAPSRILRFVGEKAGDRAGASATSLGDLDDDGFSDLAIGAVRGDGDEKGAGLVYFVRGRAIEGNTLSLADVYVALRGKGKNDYLGEVLRGGVDVDGDGISDVLVSSRGESKAASAGGVVYVLSGKGLAGR